MTELTPKFILVVHLIVELYLYVHNTIAALRESPFFSHLLVSKYIFFQWFGHLLKHLLSRIAGNDCHDDALPDSGVWEFILAHLR